jgi:hypothetical protein
MMWRYNVEFGILSILEIFRILGFKFASFSYDTGQLLAANTQPLYTNDLDQFQLSAESEILSLLFSSSLNVGEQGSEESGVLGKRTG